MIEPTESEDLAELDRFCDAMIEIRREIQRVADGGYDREDNPLKNAPHTAACLLSDDWKHPYTRDEAAYPVPSLRETKYWPRSAASTRPTATATSSAPARPRGLRGLSWPRGDPWNPSRLCAASLRSPASPGTEPHAVRPVRDPIRDLGGDFGVSSRDAAGAAR